MSQAVSAATSAAPDLTTLRSLIDQRHAKQQRFRIDEVVAIVVPICTDLAQRHARNETIFVHASSIGAGPDGIPRIIPDLARRKPIDARDSVALAPELATRAPDARSSVFALGALVYEMLTLQPIGAGMKPPTQLVPGLPPIVDNILAKALITDPSQRPADLPAFAQAIHHFAPHSIAPPPPADEHAFEVHLDLKSSMLPPAPNAGESMEVNLDGLSIPKATQTPRIEDVVAPPPVSGSRVSTGGQRPAIDDPFAAIVDARASSPGTDPQRISQSRAHDELSQLKARLEADPTPRWMIVKDKMDHGPFAAIELLQMIASDRFEPDDTLIDTHNNVRVALKDHPQFSRFAHHARLKRDHVKETKAVAQAEKSEKGSAAFKLAGGILLVAAAIAGVIFVVTRIQAGQAEKERQRKLEADQLAAEGSIKAAEAEKKKNPTWGGGGAGAGAGYGGGSSYEDALKKSVTDLDGDFLTQGECGAPLSNSLPLDCGFSGGKASASFAVKNGSCLGVTVTTDPPQPGVNSCLAARIRGSHWKAIDNVSKCNKWWASK